jgi:OOP family OmpA-OmpF porin
MSVRISAVLIVVCLLTLQPAHAELTASEIPNGHDNPLISRYAGSILQNVADDSFVSIRVPAGAGRLESDGKIAFQKSSTVEGHLQSYFYVGPQGRTALEIYRNYQGALQNAGATVLYQCEMAECDAAAIREHYSNEVVSPRAWQPNRYGNPASSVDRDVRFISARMARNGQDAYVLVYVAEPNSLWKAPASVVLVVEPKAMETGKVVVDLDTLRRSLQDEGRIALYGIYFDTGKAALRPESKAQLDEMAKLLKNDANLKVYIVGHTDNQGALENNRALSKQRAEAVRNALAKDYKIEPARMQPEGLASLAPVASNSAETGRAKNRRVELVVQ